MAYLLKRNKFSTNHNLLFRIFYSSKIEARNSHNNSYTGTTFIRNNGFQFLAASVRCNTKILHELDSTISFSFRINALFSIFTTSLTRARVIGDKFLSFSPEFRENDTEQHCLHQRYQNDATKERAQNLNTRTGDICSGLTMILVRKKKKQQLGFNFKLK